MTVRMKRRSVLLGTGLVLLCGSAIWFGNDVALSLESSAPSRSIGTVANGRLDNGHRLPGDCRASRSPGALRAAPWLDYSACDLCARVSPLPRGDLGGAGTPAAPALLNRRCMGPP